MDCVGASPLAPTSLSRVPVICRLCDGPYALGLAARVGRCLKEVVADEFRQDLLDAEIGDGTYGFRVNIGPLITSDVPHVIRVEAQDANSLQWTDIDWTPLTITCTEIFGTHEGFQGVATKAECQATG